MEWFLLIGAGYVALKLRRHVAKYRILQKSKPIRNAKHDRTLKEENEPSLSQEQTTIFKLLDATNQHYFITGKAGTGKSLLLRYFVRNTNKSVVVLAPTGIAAMNVKGQTIHSMFRFRLGVVQANKLKLHEETRKILEVADVLLIDEISMVRADIIDGIDILCRKARKNNIPFGGIQIIAFGDLYQLPPVIGDRSTAIYFEKNYQGSYFFNAHIMNDVELRVHDLKTVFRQKDPYFKIILDAMRTNNLRNEHLNHLHNRVTTPELLPKTGVPILTPYAATAEKINYERLLLIPTKSKKYYATVSGYLAANAFPTSSELTLKPGAQVMFIKNDTHKRWVNGTIGVIDSPGTNTIFVNKNGQILEVKRETWEKLVYAYDDENDQLNQSVSGSFTQFPLKLAWAITIHKSQGSTFQSVAIDLSADLFAHGQAYVAFSRCKSLNGLYLLGELKNSDIIVDPNILTFMQHAVETVDNTTAKRLEKSDLVIEA
jgi:ATP-dependent DNA helicase PIF1